MIYISSIDVRYISDSCDDLTNLTNNSSSTTDRGTTIATPQEEARTDSPVVGILVTPATGSNALAGAIVRAQGAGHEVIVASLVDHDSEVIQFAEQQGAQVIGLDEDVEPKKAIQIVARQEGYPGVLWQSEVEVAVDFEAGSERSYESDEYLETVEPLSGGHPSPNVLVGIPTYNEEVGIGSVIVRSQEYADEVVVCDDGSEDNTVAIAKRTGARVISHPENRGKGAAVRSLLDHAQTRNFDSLVLLDGDGQHTPDEIPRIIEPIVDGDADLVIGSRYLDDGGEDETPSYRRVGQRILDYLTIGPSKTNVTDSQSGYRALSPRAVEEVDVSTDSFGVESEMIDEAARHDLTISERSIEARYEGIDGQTQNPLRHGLEVVTFLLQLIRDRHPLIFFGVPGLVLATGGLFYGVDGILIYRTSGVFYPAKAMVSGFLTIIGTLGVFTGLMLNRVANIVSTSLED